MNNNQGGHPEQPPVILLENWINAMRTVLLLQLEMIDAMMSYDTVLPVEHQNAPTLKWSLLRNGLTGYSLEDYLTSQVSASGQVQLFLKP